MSRTLVPRYLASLEVSRLTDEEVHTVSASIALVAPTCPLVLASATMQACVAALGTKDATLAKMNTAVAADRQALRSDIAAEAFARADVRGQLRTYLTLLANDARSPADIASAGLLPQGPRPPKYQQPAVPQLIATKIPKTGRGKAMVSVQDAGPKGRHFVAEQSVDGVTWTALGVGYGRSRTVTGASGAQIWVRFAAVRGQLQSAFSTPVLVTIP